MSIFDRRDGKRERDLHGFQNILIDFAPSRAEREVYMNANIDVTNFVKFMKKEKEKNEDLTMFHGISCIMAKTIYSKPLLNRFIAGRSMYIHNNVSLASSIKESFDDKSVEILMVNEFKPEDTLYDVSNTVKEKVNKIRAKKADGGGANDAADTVGNLPKYLRIFVVGLLKFLDRHGLLPKSITDDNLYYSSAILSNIGVFKVGGIYHNLKDFGTSSMLITFGEIKKEEKGNRYFMEMGATLDEGIADGFYFCKTLKLIEYMFSHPEVMLEPCGKKVVIPENEK